MSEKKRKNSDSKVTSFRIKVDLLGIEKGEKTPPIKAYLFSSSGELLDSRIVSEKKAATLKTDYGFGKQGKYRITIGPDLENSKELKKASGRSTSVTAVIGKVISLVDDEWPVDDAPKVESDGSILFNVHVDNNDTVASLESVGFSGTTPLECQFLEYTSLSQEIEVKYQAYHPNGFLSHYNLIINRGMSGTRQSPGDWLGVKDPAGPPVTTPAAEGLSSTTVGSLLDTHSRCAFSVRLHTYLRTRNGYNRIREYEDSDVGAFALVQK